MILKNSHYYFKNALTPEQCQSIIELGNSKIVQEATTFGNDEKGKNPNTSSLGDKLTSEVQDTSKYHLRDSKISWITEQWVSDLVIPFIEEANKRAGWKFDFDQHESFQFTRYKEKGAFYGWHTDGGGDWSDIIKKEIPGVTPSNMMDKKYSRNINSVGKVRKISATIALNTGYTGGDLKFDYGPHVDSKNRYQICEAVRDVGSVCVFPSFVHHCVTPIETGERYSLVVWCLGRPFR
tara:strand:- start:3954 stop:4664 length:711 start_codon:yes stop_codon:yes gene_type:complete